ncbi:MAG: hypothetical protein GYB65_21075 [Chloroflexi bacterium]|nr:hypothetical protein [Chloroflexota bacterium]
MQLWNRYFLASSVDETLELLLQYDGQARIIAGGTDLLIEMREGHRPPQPVLVDITAIPALTTIEQDNDQIILGACVTHARITHSTALQKRATCLVESCGVVGGPQVRNVGTIGGNVAHALPAGDGTTSLVALDAEAEVVIDGERHWRPILELFQGPGVSLLDSTRDLLVRFRFQAHQPHEGSAFDRIMRPQGVALPILGCAVWVRLNADNSHYEAARICIAPVGPTPRRITAVENMLAGCPATEDTLEAAVALAQEVIKPRTSKYRATAPYRSEMVAVLLRRALPAAVERAKTTMPVTSQ